MGKQVIISIGREFGSGGHEIGEKLAERLGFKFYDRKMLDELAETKNISIEYLEKYDEKPKRWFGSRTVGAHTNSMEEIVAEMQFEYIQEKADSGESFVIVGRCSEAVLKGHEGLISIFILGNRQEKLERVKERYQLGDQEALAKMKRHDYKRKQYHNRHADGKWGDSRTYDLCINSSHLGVEKTVDILQKYVEERM
ncbi:MAG: cytidylate kinase-like family protein [Lachnospiraceae bacterium]|nr:cytidylate kinase-like family protein [Lachnospiraceae bacterium]